MAGPASHPEPIAIIGSACHFAGEVSSPSKLWDLLREPGDLRSEISDSRFSSRGFYHADHTQPGHSNVRHSYLLSEDPALFDAEFFGIKPVEAKAIDPQQRWLLETVYEGIEAAGLTIQGLRGSDTGVYVGVMCSDYESMLLRDPLMATPTYMATGTAKSILSNRLSYVFDWRGPSITVDTACSSSLVAVHMAVQALRAGESRIAVACGSNLILGPENYIIESKLRMLSPDGVCRMWDQDANGYARGEGVAAVVLKTLSAALADGDHIECIIRETGLNQDGGTTSGITIPSASAQRDLIRSTYARAGLDPLGNPGDRPQYFEAHGTGTPAGDPVEAEAIYRAFFGDGDGGGNVDPRPQLLPDNSGSCSPPLYVGSVKTVLGHTEGTAGLAGILKASLALQHGLIPPNLHFKSLSDRVAPFYRNVEIVRGRPRPWPVASPGAKQQEFRRASVNSFGFGGMNAHAILESYNPEPGAGAAAPICTGPLFTPFVFSAGSDASLRASLGAYAPFLGSDRALGIDAHDLAWTLRQRRSALAHRTYVAAASVDDLRQQLVTKLQAGGNNTAIGVRVSGSGCGNRTPVRLLGIFTGQGAQFTRMGAELVEQSGTARRIFQELEAHLAALPPGDRPSWSLTEELLAPAASSRVQEAAVAQPLCTAVQILLVDLLRLAGVRFDAVVGHSSGEIGAAYAAGALSARDALCVAYFRGLYAGLAASPRGQHIRGAMIAVGTSMADAEELCRDEVYAGRLVVAASNSSSSVTISGDEDAVTELQDLLEDENKFYRRLRVDTAYHSPHMDPCVAPYVEALRRSGVEALRPAHHSGSGASRWFSSVHDRWMDLETETGLSDTYWAENMTHPVLFSHALRTALLSTDAGGYDLVVEIGPHPALQSPACQTIRETTGSEPAYHGTLARKIDAVAALSASLGFLWQHGAPVELDRYERAMRPGEPGQRYKLVKGLPSYQWNHSARHWAEPRFSRRMRLRREPWHPLLGHATPDCGPHRLQWRNILRATTAGEQDDGKGVDNGQSWLAGHRVQGQVVFPAAGYVATALEAARALPGADAASGPGSETDGRSSLLLVEIRDLVIHQAVVLASEISDGGVEVLIELADISPVDRDNRICARFTYSAALGRKDDGFTLAASAEIEVLVGTRNELDPKLLAERHSVMPHMVDVEPQRFYTSLSSLGYEYEGRFRSLDVLKRKHGKASCLVRVKARHSGKDSDDGCSPVPLLAHPAELDAAFQSLLLAYSYPGDDQLRTLHLPVRIDCIRVNPALCGSPAWPERTLGSITKQYSGQWDPPGEVLVPVDATVLRPTDRGSISPQRGFSGDITIYTTTSPHAAIQVQNVQLRPLGGSAEEGKDRNIFLKMNWVAAMPDGHAAAAAGDDRNIISPRTRAAFDALERIAAFYLRQFDAQVPADSPLRSPAEGGATACYLQYARRVASSLAERNQEWLRDSLADIREATREFDSLPDVRVMHLVGETMPAVFRGQTTMLERFRETGVLDDYYVNGFASAPSGRWQARIVSQIADRHPHLNMLELGAGTGGTTKRILGALGRRFQSYTFTDVSAGFFGPAADALAAFQDRLTFKVLDIERDPITQGFQQGAYDVVIASFVLHATASLERTLAHARALLRPGGFLVVGEGSLNCGPSNFIFGPLPGWWLGRGDQGRTDSPHISAAEWDRLLRATGFSGIDTRAPVEWEDHLGVCLFASQAVDDRVKILREPLCDHAPQQRPMVQKLVLVGGQTSRTAPLMEDLSALLRPFARNIRVFPSLLDIPRDGVLLDGEGQPAAVLSLTDLDKPVFKDMEERDFVAFRRMFEDGKTLLWVTSGRGCQEPYNNMVVGFGRTAAHETAGLHLQHLDLADPQHQDAACLIAEAFLRLVARPGPVEDAGGSGKSNILWTAEPEMVIDAEGRQLVPRLQHLSAPNDRYNSGRRRILREVDISKDVVAVHRDHRGIVSLEKLLPDRSGPCPEERLVELRLSHAVLSALRTQIGLKFLVAGRDTQTGVRYLALSPFLASVIRLPEASTMPYPSEDAPEESLLSLAAAHLIAAAVIDPLVPGQTVVVHNAANRTSRAIAFQASSNGVTAVFVADQDFLRQASIPPSDRVTPLAPYLTRTALWQLLPAPHKITCFVSLDSSTHSSKPRDMIVADLPPWCRRESPETLFSRTGCDSSRIASDTERELLQRASDYAAKNWTACQAASSVADLRELVAEGKEHTSTDSTDHDPLTVVTFPTSTLVPVQITRLDARRSMFRPDRTYWMVGLSGALGVSLCDWMIASGARHVVLSSRNPQIEPAWVDTHRRDGVAVSILPCDITDYSALVAAHHQIRGAHPPVAGVFNGAMVLRDTSIRNMTFAQLNDVVRPKVLGSLNLDRLFSADNLPPLDFFVLLSSINCIIGNQGQANYAAANAFQCALAASRRSRGLPGVALNVGAIIGAGYIQRSSKRVLDLTVSRGAMMHLSEEDFHQLVAEAIAAEYDESIGPELSTGLMEISHDSEERPVWFSDPKFSHLIVPRSGRLTEGAMATPAESLNVAAAPVVRARLRACRTRKEAAKVVTEAFATQLRRDLQMTTPDDELMEMRSSEIGMDSLISVDMRSWFHKTLAVNIPVLLFMNSDTTMTSLVQLAVDKLPPEMVPQLHPSCSTDNHGFDGAPPAHSPSRTGSVSDVDTSSTQTAVAMTPDIGHDWTHWDDETLPPSADGDAVALEGLTGPVSSPPQTIVLTGATGLLGRHLLRHLLRTTSAKIICIAVRQPITSSKQGRDLLSTLLSDDNETEDATSAADHRSRVSLYAGDLALPRLGLSPQDCSAIFSAADAVVHAGADTSHLKPYASLRAANVNSTAELARLCLPRRVPLHYVSSAGVGLFATPGPGPGPGPSQSPHDPEQPIPELWPARAPGTPPPPPQLLHGADGSAGGGGSGYTASKWASERLLERTSAARGLPVWIHRPSTILRQGADAEGDKARLDWLNGLVRYARALRAVPEIRHVRGALDMVRVRSVCEGLAGCLFQEGGLLGGGGGGVVSYVHEVGDFVVPLDRLDLLMELRLEGETMAETNGTKVSCEVIPMAEWVARAVDHGLHPAVAALIEGMDGPGRPNYPRLRRDPLE